MQTQMIAGWVLGFAGAMMAALGAMMRAPRASYAGTTRCAPVRRRSTDLEL